MQLDLGGLSKEAILDDKKINEGVWIHFDSLKRDPETGEPIPMYLNGDTSKPQRGLVRSHRCKAIKAAEETRQKQGFVKMRAAKKKERDGVIVESSILPEELRFSLILVALENFGAAGGRQDIDLEAAKYLLNESSVDHVVQQVKEASYDDDNYLADASTEPGNGSASSTSETKTATPKPAQDGSQT